MTDREMVVKALKTIEELIEWQVFMGGFDGRTWSLAKRTRHALEKHLEITQEVP